MARFLTLVVLVGITHILGLLRVPGTRYGSATLFLGFLLLASYLAGRAARSAALPRITGYLVIGILVGPYVLGILPMDVLREFRFVNGVALALIALSAGGELRMGTLRARMRSIGLITLLQVLMVFSLVGGVVYSARGMIGFLEGQPPRVALAVALLFGLVAVAKSPATTIAVITEEKAQGVLTDTVLGITVVKDVVILILIALLIPLASAIVDPVGGFSFQAVREILLEITGSLALGTALGWMVTQYLRRIRSYRVLFVLGVAFLSVYLGEELELEYILIAMAAGFFVQNFSQQGGRLIQALETNSLPVYALFFAVAGADLDITTLRSAWAVVTAILLARAGSLWLSTFLGAGFAHDPPAVRHHAWMGFLAQAGVTLGIANLVRDRFPVWGVQVASVIVAMIVVNQLIGPPAFRWALVRAGECRVPQPRKRRRR